MNIENTKTQTFKKWKVVESLSQSYRKIVTGRKVLCPSHVNHREVKT